MKKLDPKIVIAAVVIALLALGFSIYHTAHSNDAAALSQETPKPREGSPTFSLPAGAHILGKGGGGMKADLSTAGNGGLRRP